MALIFGSSTSAKNKKRTRQGCGRGTKFGAKHSKKKYIKKYRNII